MTNEQIIANEAILNGLYTEEQIKAFAEAGEETPVHTLQGWLSRGMKVRKGEHACLETRLWRKKSKKKKDVAEEQASSEQTEGLMKEFYLAKAFLFKLDQVEKIEK